MAARTCTECSQPVHLRGMCRSHYFRQQDRDRGHRHRDDKVLYSRARNRATARLVELHREEFDRLFAEELDKAAAEAEKLGNVVTLPASPAPAKASVVTGAAVAKTSVPVVRLRPGPRPHDEPEAVDRVRPDVAKCTKCHSYHDRGHVCPRCSEPPANAPVAKKIEHYLRNGHSAAWVANKLGEPMGDVMKVLEKVRRDS